MRVPWRARGGSGNGNWRNYWKKPESSTFSPRCNAGSRFAKPRGGHITPRRGVYIARRPLLRSLLPFPRAEALLHVASRLRRRSTPAKTAATDGEKREKIPRDHAMKESAIMGWSNQPDGAAALPVLVMLDARCPFLRTSPCADKAPDSQLGFCGAKYAARVLAKNP